jgi:hypothetical protein
MLLVVEMIAGLQVGHLPNPIFERDRCVAVQEWSCRLGGKRIASMTQVMR